MGWVGGEATWLALKMEGVVSQGMGVASRKWKSR